MEEVVDLDWLKKEVIGGNKKWSNVCGLSCVDIRPVVGDGENYASVLLRVRLKAVTLSGGERDLSLVLKRTLDMKDFDETLRDVVTVIQEANLKEYTLYSDIFPILDGLMGENVKLWPECLASIKGKELYLEDLKESGFEISDRLSGLDVDHCHLVMESLGRFHAASYIAVSEGLIDGRKHCKYPAVDGTTSTRRVHACHYMAEVILQDWGPQWKEIGEKLKDLTMTIRGKVEEVGALDERRINVMNHGDPWVNNMMFKYDTTAKHQPQSLRFVDFQISHYNCFAFDISYFLYSSTGPEIRLDHLDSLIETYCESFKRILTANGSELPRPTEATVRAELKRIGWFSLMTSIRVRPVIMCRPEHSLPLARLMRDDGLTPEKRKIYANPALERILKIDLPDLFQQLEEC